MKVREIKKLLEGFDGDVEVYVVMKVSEGVMNAREVAGVSYNALDKRLALFGLVEETVDDENADDEENVPEGE